MRSKRLFLSAGVLLATSAIAPLTFAGRPASRAAAALNPIEGSRVHARIELIDNGDSTTGLEILGTATGLEPGNVYISLVYDTGSIPGGPSACLPSPSDNLDAQQMFVGTWTVDAAGNGTLKVSKAGPSYVPVVEIGAMSVRLAVDRSLQACGRVHPAP